MAKIYNQICFLCLNTIYPEKKKNAHTSIAQSHNENFIKKKKEERKKGFVILCVLHLLVEFSLHVKFPSEKEKKTFFFGLGSKICKYSRQIILLIQNWENCFLGSLILQPVKTCTLAFRRVYPISSKTGKCIIP